MIKFFQILFFSFCILSSVQSFAQENVATLAKKYPFLKTGLNTIGNSKALENFYETLYQKIKKKSVIKIVHIGDSHIQADFFSGIVRKVLQTNFGNSGRGLVTPYRLAKTGEPLDYDIFSNKKWKFHNIVGGKTPLPIGVSGITVKTEDLASTITIRVNDTTGMDYSFNSLTLFYEKGASTFDFNVYDSNDNELGNINARTETQNRFISKIEFDTLIKSIKLQPVRKYLWLQQFTQIYGMSLENGKPGILYHTIGVNGATFQNYNSAEYFVEQLARLEPDLIIISLGTNDAYIKNFHTQELYDNIDEFISTLRNEIPEASFLLTTPANSYKKRKKENPNVKTAATIIKQYCTANDVAYWDLYSIMGGNGSMLKWYKNGLAGKDKIHFTRTGYEIQGTLLSQALLNEFRIYKKLQH